MAKTIGLGAKPKKADENTELKALKKEISALEKENKELKTENAELKAQLDKKEGK